jgi:hypothetical protein
VNAYAPKTFYLEDREEREPPGSSPPRPATESEALIAARLAGRGLRLDSPDEDAFETNIDTYAWSVQARVGKVGDRAPTDQR